VPREPAGWSAARLIAPASWTAPRALEIETTPPDTSLDLFYLRGNRQQLLAHGAAPARVKLPSRVAAARGDVLVIRALRDGYRERELRVAVRGEIARVQIDLDPLPNALERIALRYFAGRAALVLETRERPAFRVTRSERGVNVLLRETPVPAQRDVAGSARPLVEEIALQPLGTDLVVSAALTERGRAESRSAPRLRESFDPVRERHVLAVELAAGRDAESAIDRATDALARIPRTRIAGCALSYDRALHDALASEESARAANDEARDAIARAAITRLAALSPGAVERVDAAAGPSDSVGYFALLRAAVDEIEAPPDRRSALQFLIAPERGEAPFGAALDRAETAERSCLHRHR
jgi:hypothetical protein